MGRREVGVRLITGDRRVGVAPCVCVLFDPKVPLRGPAFVFDPPTSLTCGVLITVGEEVAGREGSDIFALVAFFVFVFFVRLLLDHRSGTRSGRRRRQVASFALGCGLALHPWRRGPCTPDDRRSCTSSRLVGARFGIGRGGLMSGGLSLRVCKC